MGLELKVPSKYTDMTVKMQVTYSIGRSRLAFAEGIPFADGVTLAVEALVFAGVDVAVLSFLLVVLAGVTAAAEVLGGLAFDFAGVDLTAASETGALLGS